MPFCTKCGRQLQDGEVCDCQPREQSPAEPTEQNATPEKENKTLFNPDSLNKVNEKLGNLADASEKKISELADSGKEKYNEIKKDPKKWRIFLIIAAIAAVIVLVLIIRGCTGGGGYMTPINDLVDAINDGEKVDFLDLYTAYCTKELKSLCREEADLFPDELEYKTDDLREYFEEMNDILGKWEMEFEVTDKEKLDGDDLENYEDELRDLWDDQFEDVVEEIEDMDSDDIDDMAEMLDTSTKKVKSLMDSCADFAKTFKNASVSGGYKVKGSFVLKDKKGDEIDSTNRVSLYVLKINGSWTVYASKDGDRFGFKDTENEYYNIYYFLTKYLNNFYIRSIGDMGDLF